MLRFISRVLLSFFLLSCTGLAGFVACSLPPGDPDIVVAIRKAVPFTVPGSGEKHSGFAVDLWEDVALRVPKEGSTLLDLEELAERPKAERDALRPSVDYAVCTSIDEQEQAMASGQVDVVISPLTITAARMEKYDFSQQYLSSGLALALPRSNAIDFEQATAVVTETLFQPTVARAIVGFLAFNLVMAFLIRAFLIGKDGPLFIGVRHVLEAITRTVGLRGVGDDYSTATAKLLEIFMAIVGTALSATILGVLTTAFVGSIGQSRDIPARNFTTMHIATLKCSTAQTYLFDQYEALDEGMAADDPLKSVLAERLTWLACDEDTRIDGPAEMSEPTGLPGRIVLAREWEQALKMLEAGEVEAVLGDWVAMTYLVREGALKGADIEVQDRVYLNEPYGWAVARKPGSDQLRRAIDSALILQMRDPGWRKRLEDELGAGSVAPH